VGPTCRRAEERGRIPLRVLIPGGPWASSRPGPEWFPGAIFYFYFLFFFSFSVFLISFITFANLVQIASNQLCKVSKIQNNNPE
jgi:hypothetical protein